MNRFMIVWLVSHRHGSQRLRVPSDDGGSSRVRLQLPRLSWFEHRLTAAGVECTWGDDPSEAQAAYCISGLAVLRPTTVYEGCLTTFSVEEQLLRSYYKKPQDCVALRVVRSARLVDAFDCFHVRGATLGKPGSVRQVVPMDTFALLDAVGSAGPPCRPQGELRRVQEILHEWGHGGVAYTYT
jgi:hypothetical protein